MTIAEQIAEDISRNLALGLHPSTLNARLNQLIAARTQPLEAALREALAALKEAKHGAEYEDALGDIIDSAIVKATAALAATTKGAR